MDAHTYKTTYNATASFSNLMEQQPMVESLRPGSCATAIQLHHLAEQYARHLLPTANTNGCSGSPGKIFPFLSTVCDEDTLTRTALHTVEEGGRVVPRSPLKIQTSKAEQKAA